jgi:hypothetical protein
MLIYYKYAVCGILKETMMIMAQTRVFCSIMHAHNAAAFAYTRADSKNTDDPHIPHDKNISAK